MILESINNDEYTWVSADGVYLVIKEGKLLKLMVFPITYIQQYLHLRAEEETIDLNQEYISYLSFREPELNNLKVASTYSSEETTEEQLTFNKKTLLRIREKVIFFNYWLGRRKSLLGR